MNDIFHKLAKNMTKDFVYYDLDNDDTLAVIKKENYQFDGYTLKSFEDQCEYLTILYNDVKRKRPMLQPYSIEDIVNYEKEHHFTFPPLLRYYLLTISRESILGSYPIIIEFDPNLKSQTEITDDEILNEFMEERDDDTNLNGTLQIVENGCDFNAYVIVKGKGEGYVLEWDHMEGYYVSSLWKLLRNPNPWVKSINSFT